MIIQSLGECSFWSAWFEVASKSTEDVCRTRQKLKFCPLATNEQLPCNTTPNHTMPYHTTPCHATPCHTIPCQTIPYHTIPCQTIPYPTILHHAIPHRTLPYHIIPLIPYLTIPYHTIPHHTIPCHTCLFRDHMKYQETKGMDTFHGSPYWSLLALFIWYIHLQKKLKSFCHCIFTWSFTVVYSFVLRDWTCNADFGFIVY